jgi:Tol biopolymer transport system component
VRPIWGGLAVSVLAGVGLVACGSGEERVGRTDGCGRNAPVIAFDHETTEPGWMGGGRPQVSVLTAGGDIELVTGSWVANDAAFSPDGDHLVVVKADGDYESAGPQATALWVIGTDGSEPRELTGGRVLDEDPDWSPDGDSIVFVRVAGDASGFSRSIQTVPSEGGEPAELVSVSDDRLEEPAWSPDGRRIAFVRSVHTLTEFTSSVWTMNADGTDPRRLADLPRVESLDWHPHGTTLLVDTDEDSYLVDADTGELQRIGAGADRAAWAPDGRGLSYFRDVVPLEDRYDDWTIAEGRIERGTLVDQRTVLAESDLTDTILAEVGLYPSYSLAVGPCA